MGGGRMVAVMLGAGLALGSPSIPAKADDPVPDWRAFGQAGTQRAGDMATAFEGLAAGIDRRIFDVEALAPDFAGKPEAAAAFVRDTIRYEPYAGLLRGADGTLSAGAGNDLDQALLLARLLRLAGTEVEILRAALGPADSRRLLAAITPQMPEDRPVLTAEGRKALQSLAGQTRNPVPLPHSPAASPLALPEAVEAARPALGPETPADVDDLLAEIADYHYLRWRTGKGVWHEEHPAFGGAAPPAVTPVETATADIPAAWQHRLRVELFADRLEFDRLVREPLMHPWERPVANLFGHPLTLALAPLGTGDTTAFVALIEGGIAPGAVAVTALGLTGPVEDLASGEGAYFQTVGGKFGGAAQGLLSLGEAEDKPDDGLGLARVMLRYTLLAPGRPPRIEERPLLDRITEDGGLTPLPASELADRLVQRRTIFVAPGGNHMARTLALTADAAASRLRALPPLFGAAMGGDPEAVEAARRALGLFTLASPVATSTASLLDGPRDTVNGTWHFRPAAAVFSFDEYLWRGDVGLDVVANPWRSLRRRDDGLPVPASGAMAAGLVDTWLEGRLIRGDDGSYLRSGTAFPESGPAVDIDGLDDAIRDAIRSDIDKGFIVRLLPPSDGPARWLRVDPGRGEALGRSLAGGSEIAEYETFSARTMLALNLALASRGVSSCYDSYGAGRARNCCLAGVAAMAVAGGAAGFAMTAPIQAFLVEGGASFAQVLTAFVVDATATLLLETVGSLAPDGGTFCK